MKILINRNIFNIDNLLYLALVFLVLYAKVISYDFTSYLYSFLAFCFIFLTIKNVKKLFKVDKYFIIYIIYVTILLLYGIINNNFISFILVDIFSFFSVIFIYNSRTRNDKKLFFNEILPKLGVIINILSIFFVIYNVFKNGVSFASVFGGRNLVDIEGQIMSPKYLLYGSLFIYPLVLYIKSSKSALIYHISIFLFILFSLAMSSRGTTAVGLLVLILTHLTKRGLKLNLRLILNKKFFSYIILLFVLLISIYQIPKIKLATDFLIYRFTIEETLEGESRAVEAQEILNNMTGLEIVFGKGLGASNHYWIFESTPNGVNNTHFGWMFLILKGGIIFLIFIYLKIILSIYKALNSKKYVPYGIILICFLLLELSHTNFNSFYRLIFMFLALSCISLAETKNEN